jgi:hypothetical protein
MIVFITTAVETSNPKRTNTCMFEKFKERKLNFREISSNVPDCTKQERCGGAVCKINERLAYRRDR